MKHLKEYIIEQQNIDEGLWDKIVKGFKKFWGWLSGDVKSTDVDNFRDYDFDFTANDKYNRGSLEIKSITLENIKDMLKTRSDIKTKKGFYQIESDINTYQKYLNTETLKCICMIYDSNIPCGVCIFDYQPTQLRKDISDDAHEDYIHIYSAQIKKDFANQKLFDTIIQNLVKNVKNDENLKGITASCSSNEMLKAYAKYGFKKYMNNMVEYTVKK